MDDGRIGGMGRRAAPGVFDHKISDIAAFDISPTRGFLCDPDPLRSLPAPFAPWEEIAHDLPKLLGAERVRAAIESLPEIGTDALADGIELRRAMVVLSFLGHAYVWGDGAPSSTIPPMLAVPWYKVASRLGRPPVLSYASYALDNWRRIDRSGPIALGNVAIQQNFLGGLDEDWFIAVHVDIEAKAADILAAIPPALAAVASEDVAGLTQSLERIAARLEDATRVLQRMPEGCDPYIYYRRVRPYIHGWKNNPALPDGVVYEGVEAFLGRPQVFRGETGAQSSIVPTLDAFLGIAHADDPLRAYLMEMRDYMPPGHRAFLSAIEAAPAVRPFVMAAGGKACELSQTYEACLRWLEKFRSVHLEFAASYINRQAKGATGNPNAVGTGGTPFMEYLRKHRDETAAHNPNGGERAEKSA